MVAGKGSGRQRVYFCDQKKQGCAATVRWVKHATSSWKLTYLNGTHRNCGGATTSASLRGMDDVIVLSFFYDVLDDIAHSSETGGGGDASAVFVCPVQVRQLP